MMSAVFLCILIGIGYVVHLKSQNQNDQAQGTIQYHASVQPSPEVAASTSHTDLQYSQPTPSAQSPVQQDPYAVADARMREAYNTAVRIWSNVRQKQTAGLQVHSVGQDSWTLLQCESTMFDFQNAGYTEKGAEYSEMRQTVHEIYDAFNKLPP